MATEPHVRAWARQLQHLVPKAVQSKLRFLVDQKQLTEDEAKQATDHLVTALKYPYAAELQHVPREITIPIADLPPPPPGFSSGCGGCGAAPVNLATAVPAMHRPPPWWKRVLNFSKALPAMAVSGFLGVPALIAEERLATCRQCDRFQTNGVCTECGCFMQFKARLAAMECPRKKWSTFVPKAVFFLVGNWVEHAPCFRRWLRALKGTDFGAVIANQHPFPLPDTPGIGYLDASGVRPSQVWRTRVRTGTLEVFVDVAAPLPWLLFITRLRPLLFRQIRLGWHVLGWRSRL